MGGISIQTTTRLDTVVSTLNRSTQKAETVLSIVLSSSLVYIDIASPRPASLHSESLSQERKKIPLSGRWSLTTWSLPSVTTYKQEELNS